MIRSRQRLRWLHILSRSAGKNSDLPHAFIRQGHQKIHSHISAKAHTQSRHQQSMIVSRPAQAQLSFTHAS